MTISAALLNLSVIIKRKDVTQVSESGEVKDAYETVATGVKMRITSNEQFDNSIKEMGWRSLASHIGFMNTGIDVEENDIITREDNNEQHVVKGVDKEPGGVVNSHYEVGLTKRNYIEA